MTLRNLKEKDVIEAIVEHIPNMKEYFPTELIEQKYIFKHFKLCFINNEFRTAKRMKKSNDAASSLLSLEQKEKQTSNKEDGAKEEGSDNEVSCRLLLSCLLNYPLLVGE